MTLTDRCSGRQSFSLSLMLYFFTNCLKVVSDTVLNSTTQIPNHRLNEISPDLTMRSLAVSHHSLDRFLCMIY